MINRMHRNPTPKSIFVFNNHSDRTIITSALIVLLSLLLLLAVQQLHSSLTKSNEPYYETFYHDNGNVSLMVEYNASGNKVSGSQYDEYGTLECRHEYTYRDNNVLLQESFFSYDTGSIITRHYSAAGMLEKEIFKTTVNSSRSEYHYDEKGNNTYLAFYNASGNLTSETVSLYDQNNLLEQSQTTHWPEKYSSNPILSS